MAQLKMINNAAFHIFTALWVWEKEKIRVGKAVGTAWLFATGWFYCGENVQLHSALIYICFINRDKILRREIINLPTYKKSSKLAENVSLNRVFFRGNYAQLLLLKELCTICHCCQDTPSAWMTPSFLWSSAPLDHGHDPVSRLSNEQRICHLERRILN